MQGKIQRIIKNEMLYEMLYEMQNNNAMDILAYTKTHKDTFEKGGVSSNEISFFDFDGKKYILKSPLMVGENLSPFWRMMKNVFRFTFEKQNAHLHELYNVLKDNPHIAVAPLVAADEKMMIYEYVEGCSLDADEFPRGTDNANRLGKYVGYIHKNAYENCGIIGVQDVPDFYERVLLHIEEYIQTYWNSGEAVDQKVRCYFETLRERRFTSSRNALIMVDMCADQFLYEGENVKTCVDLDAYVIGPVEWELSFLKTQIEDWDSFKRGYEVYQAMPAFEQTSKLFFFLMALNAYWDKDAMDDLLSE